jgi:hypothetical protein
MVATARRRRHEKTGVFFLEFKGFINNDEIVLAIVRHRP